MPTNRRTSTKPRPHPLEWIALEAFADGREALDSGELAALLGGRTSAYRTIAGHVLDSLEKRGLTWSNDAGQHRPVDDPPEKPPADPFEGLTRVPVCGYRDPRPEDIPETWHSDPVPSAEVLERVRDHLRANPRQGPFIIAVVPIRADGTAERWPGPKRDDA